MIRPVGSTDAIPVNVRVISATHRDLQNLMTAGQFREDLYYRLNVVHIEMPALNRRREDIPLLVAHFLAQIAKESGVRKIYAPEAVELLLNTWERRRLSLDEAGIPVLVPASPAEWLKVDREEVRQALDGPFGEARIVEAHL